MNWNILLLSLIVVILLPLSESFSEELIIKEWDIPTLSSSPHDIVVGKNGIVWFTEIATNKIGKFDPNTEQFSEYIIPTESSRPHGLVVDNQGNVWFTEVGAGQIGKFNPLTETFEEFVTPTPNSGPHTPIFADENTLWFTEQRASQIGRLDTATGTMDEFQTITPSANPYGIITDMQGNAWFAELQGHHIGKVDAETGQVTEYAPLTDQSGPRRIAIDSNGMLWFTQFNVGKISKFDPNAEIFTEFDTSSTSSGPYAIWVDPFDNVWFSMTGISKIGKFDQSTNTLNEYDLPSPQTHIKFIHSDSNGNIWFPNYNNNKIGVILASSPPSHGIAYFPSPLKQIQNGVDPANVTCTEGLELMLKFTNGKPVCIKHSSVEKLTERGWAIHVLPDYEKSENNNSEMLAMGNFDVVTEDVNYFKNSQGYVARPVLDGNYPGIVMIHEFWGLNDNIKQMAEKLASHGYVVFAVDLYDGKVGKTADEARQLRSSFEQSQWTDNMSTAVKYLEENHSPSSMGSIGWCFGGGQSLNLALNNSDMDATVIYYGQLVTDTEELSKITWPILGIFAGLDTGITPETVKEFESSLNEIGVENDITIYPGVNHAFANPSGDRYAPNEAMDAWNKTLEFFQQNLD